MNEVPWLAEAPPGPHPRTQWDMLRLSLLPLLAGLALGGGAAALPSNVTLKNVRHEYQGPDNCAPVTALTVLGYHGTRVTQAAAAAAMKDYPGDPQVSSLELAAYLGRFGLRSVIRYAGDPDVLRELVSRGFPVVVQQRLRAGSNVAHFRTVYGYSGGSFLPPPTGGTPRCTANRT
ncbi:hypothetical protein GCM10010840_30640 [Deinococcus aerolatus]|uniref:Peptidase C39-like domain-containing protein n=2 Tax=Deinococcus aerolatus TaxID=522487 RepID=A0ABQ2GE64_9DEIO|nr:hypothetical protein GCM10010840_30640 [Deinococcus aerolatus]